MPGHAEREIECPRSVLTDWLRCNIAPVQRAILGVVGLGLCGGVLLIVQAALFAHLAAAVIFGSGTRSQLWPVFAAVAGIVVLRSALAWALERVRFVAASGIKVAVRDRLLEHIHHLGIAWQRSVPTGDVVSTLIDAVEAMEGYFGQYLPQTALAVAIPGAILVVVAPVDWISGLLLLVTAPLIPVFMILIGRGAERLNQRQWRRMGRLSGHFLDALRGITTLKLFNLSRREARLIERLSDEYRRSTLAVLRVAFLSSLVLEFLATMGIAMVAVIVGFRLLWGEIKFESAFLVLLLAPEFYLPLRSMGAVYHARMEAIGAAERILSVLEVPATRWPGHRSDVISGHGIAVRMENLGYSYPDGSEALAEINVGMAEGETVALVGPSGSGKSTFGLMLLGLLRPQSGSLIMNGVPMDAIDIEYWRRSVAWVPQQPRLFSGTVADNLRLGCPGATEDAMWRALEAAQAVDFVSSMPYGIETQIGERGVRLSGGEAQRLAIARALIKDAVLVVLDEISAHLDTESERRLTRAMRALGQGRNLLVIAHRLTTVRNANRILVLDHGRICEQGSHRALLEDDGLYARLVAATEGRA